VPVSTLTLLCQTGVLYCDLDDGRRTEILPNFQNTRAPPCFNCQLLGLLCSLQPRKPHCSSVLHQPRAHNGIGRATEPEQHCRGVPFVHPTPGRSHAGLCQSTKAFKVLQIHQSVTRSWLQDHPSRSTVLDELAASRSGPTSQRSHPGRRRHLVVAICDQLISNEQVSEETIARTWKADITRALSCYRGDITPHNAVSGCFGGIIKGSNFWCWSDSREASI
jgi:hypothetical protein